MVNAISIRREETLLEVNDRSRQLLERRLSNNDGEDQEDGLAVPLRRDKQTRIARFIDIAHQHP